MKTEIKMTKSEALAAGYEYYGYPNEQWQSLKEVAYVGDDDFGYSKLMLFDKEALYLSVDGDSICDLVTDMAVDAEGYNSDDTSDIHDDLKSQINWSEIADRVNDILKGHGYRMLTNIELVKGEAA